MRLRIGTYDRAYRIVLEMDGNPIRFVGERRYGNNKAEVLVGLDEVAKAWGVPAEHVERRFPGES